mgnify:FL=1
MTKVISINTSGTPEAGEIAQDKLLSGESATKLWHAFSNGTDQFHVGHWSSGPCELSVNYTEDELCVIVAGSVTLTGADGTQTTHAKGDAFVIPSGFSGVWKSNENVTKIYASFE